MVDRMAGYEPLGGGDSGVEGREGRSDSGVVVMIAVIPSGNSTIHDRPVIFP